MSNIIIDEEFKDLLPPLEEKAYKGLEESIIANGCMFPLVTWDDILIDGYNRYAICTKHDIPYKTIAMEFDTREDVIIWIVTNQISRRNLTPMQLSYYRGLHYNTDKKLVGNHSGKSRLEDKLGQNVPISQEQSTAARLGSQYKVTSRTVKRDGIVADVIDAIGRVSTEAKQKILSEDVKIDKKVLHTLAASPENDIADIAAKIEDGTYEKSKPEKTGAEQSDVADNVLENTRSIYEWTHSEVHEPTNEYGISTDFDSDFDSWVAEGKPDDKRILIGTTSLALQSIGIAECKIVWNTSKINIIQRQHPDMIDDVLRQVPNIIGNPLIVMESITRVNRVTVYGEVYNDKGIPVLTALELLPSGRRSRVLLDSIRVASVYSKDNINKTQTLINNSNILYICPDKVRTDTWFSRNQLQLPFGITKYGSLGNVTYFDKDVNGIIDFDGGK